jgi:hypothetical protein
MCAHTEMEKGKLKDMIRWRWEVKKRCDYSAGAKKGANPMFKN